MGAAYKAVLGEFLSHDEARVIGDLARNYELNELQKKQLLAWAKTVSVLKTALRPLFDSKPETADWVIILEYSIPRRQRKIDVVILARDLIFCLELKTEDKRYALAAARQAEEYALDLHDFHQESRGRTIIPILLIPEGAHFINPPFICSPGTVGPVVRANTQNLQSILNAAVCVYSDPSAPYISSEAWIGSRYHPVPTILEAAESLYAGHDVREISHAHADNLSVTCDFLMQVIQRAQSENQKFICFVTGVPGAGKTLAGLSLVHNRALTRGDGMSGVFLSGNGPLVRIVSAAIARDHKKKQGTSGERTVRTFIQNVHGFVKEGITKADKPPVEHVIVFDEAQRAWNSAHNFRKNGTLQSEPEVLMEIMDRHSNWAVVVALVGGGQEIHTGEAGLSEWGRTLKERFPCWQAVISPKLLTQDESVGGEGLFINGSTAGVKLELNTHLHLEVNLRSYRVRKLTAWVEAVLSVSPDKASQLILELGDYPIAFTRSLKSARAWLGEHTRGLQRCGLLASSGASRLRADGIEISSAFRNAKELYEHWFLDSPDDVRSSNQLEVAATEFECQGLELDWTGICWGGNFTFDSEEKEWRLRTWSGRKWNMTKNALARRYLLNTHRVLLTRARQGLVIWVPKGSESDSTREPQFFQETASFLKACGLREV